MWKFEIFYFRRTREERLYKSLIQSRSHNFFKYSNKERIKFSISFFKSSEQDVLKDSLHGCDIIHNPSPRKLFYLQSFHASGKFLSILKILHSLSEIPPRSSHSIIEINIISTYHSNKKIFYFIEEWFYWITCVNYTIKTIKSKCKMRLHR